MHVDRSSQVVLMETLGEAGCATEDRKKADGEGIVIVAMKCRRFHESLSTVPSSSESSIALYERTLIVRNGKRGLASFAPYLICTSYWDRAKTRVDADCRSIFRVLLVPIYQANIKTTR